MKSGCLWIGDSNEVGSCENNCWYQDGTKGTVFASINAIAYYSGDFPAYKSATGWDTNGKWEDPKFVNAGGMIPSDYKLAFGSPCIDTGTNLGLIMDYFGTTVPKGAGYDIGADEYGSLIRARIAAGTRARIGAGATMKIK